MTGIVYVFSVYVTTQIQIYILHERNKIRQTYLIRPQKMLDSDMVGKHNRPV